MRVMRDEDANKALAKLLAAAGSGAGGKAADKTKTPEVRVGDS
jgi:hypothetical protein